MKTEKRQVRCNIKIDPKDQSCELSTSCSYLVSVGKEKFQGPYLLSTLSEINKKYDTCTVIVTGTLQRFNIAIEQKISPEEAYAEALKREDKFVKEAEQLIEGFENKTCKFNFVRWDVYIKNEKFKECSNKVISLLKDSEDIRLAMDKTVEDFYKQHKKEIEEKKLNEEDFKQNSRRFLEEECATMLMWKEELGPVIYPSGASTILGKMSDYINKNLPSGKKQISWQKLDFRKISSHSETITLEKKENPDSPILQKPTTELSAPFFSYRQEEEALSNANSKQGFNIKNDMKSQENKLLDWVKEQKVAILSLYKEKKFSYEFILSILGDLANIENKVALELMNKELPKNNYKKLRNYSETSATPHV